MAKKTQATVIRFPTERIKPALVSIPEDPPTCCNCDHVFMGSRGLYCGYFNEMIVSDSEAAECSEYEPF